MRTNILSKLVLSMAVLAPTALFAFGGGCSTTAPQAGDNAMDVDPSVDLGAARQAETACAIGENCGNCVSYARCRRREAGKDLPHGLTYWEAKEALVNTHTPAVGAVAVIKTSSAYGHMAYVVGVNGDQITIEEGNWPNGSCGRRTGTVEKLHIVGFYD